jgi:hypothetical protein
LGNQVKHLFSVICHFASPFIQADAASRRGLIQVLVVLTIPLARIQKVCGCYTSSAIVSYVSGSYTLTAVGRFQ